MFIYGIYGNLILVVTTHNLAKYTHTKSLKFGWIIQTRIFDSVPAEHDKTQYNCFQPLFKMST